jgi:hypothetical protein
MPKPPKPIVDEEEIFQLRILFYFCFTGALLSIAAMIASPICAFVTASWLPFFGIGLPAFMAFLAFCYTVHRMATEFLTFSYWVDDWFTRQVSRLCNLPQITIDAFGSLWFCRLVIIGAAILFISMFFL